MAETEMIESFNQAETGQSEEVSLLKEAPGLLSSKPLLEVYGWVGRNHDSLLKATRRAGDLIAENRNKAVLAGTSLVLAASGAIACSESEASPPGVHVSFPETSTPAVESKATVPQLGGGPTIVEEAGQQPALTKVETQVSMAPSEVEATSLTSTREAKAAIQERGLFSQLREQALSSDIPQEEKERFVNIIDKLEKTEMVLDQFQEAYESQKESDGTPSLLALNVKQLGNLDFSGLYPSLSPQEARERHAQDNIFFLKDHRLFQYYLQKLQEATASPDYLTNTLQSVESDFLNNHFPYLEVQTTRGGTFEILTEKSKKQFAETFSEKEAQQIVGEIASSLPMHENLTIIITLGKNAFTRDKDGQAIIYIDRADPEMAQKFLHEYFHFIDVEKNLKYIARYLPPESLIKLMTLRAAALSSETFGRPYPSLESINDTANRYPEALRIYRSKGQLSPLQLRALSSQRSNNIWLHQEGTEPFKQILADQQLDLKAQVAPAKVETAIDNLQDLSQFLNNKEHQEFLSQLALRNKYWAEILSIIRKNPEQFNEYFIVVNPRLKFDKRAEQYYPALKEIGAALASDLLFRGDQEFSGLLSPQEKVEATDILVERMAISDLEEFADLFSQELRQTQNGLPTEGFSSPSQYLNILSERAAAVLSR